MKDKMELRSSGVIKNSCCASRLANLTQIKLSIYKEVSSLKSLFLFVLNYRRFGLNSAVYNESSAVKLSYGLKMN